MTRIVTALAIALAITPLTAQAEQICVEAQDGFRFIRCNGGMDMVRCSFMTDQTGPITCYAFDAAGEPMATSNAFGEQGAALFFDIDPEKVDNLICE